MVDHEALPGALLIWAADELGSALPETRCQFAASICAHPIVPDPHLAVLVYLAIPSLAHLGRNIGLAKVLPLNEVTESTVRATVREVAEQLATAAHQELAAANGASRLPSSLKWPP